MRTRQKQASRPRSVDRCGFVVLQRTQGPAASHRLVAFTGRGGVTSDARFPSAVWRRPGEPAPTGSIGNRLISSTMCVPFQCHGLLAAVGFAGLGALRFQALGCFPGLFHTGVPVVSISGCTDARGLGWPSWKIHLGSSKERVIHCAGGALQIPFNPPPQRS